jgi:hypothetical protein
MFLREQGISAGQRGSGIDDQFQAGGKHPDGDETASQRMVLDWNVIAA